MEGIGNATAHLTFLFSNNDNSDNCKKSDDSEMVMMQQGGMPDF